MDNNASTEDATPEQENTVVVEAKASTTVDVVVPTGHENDETGQSWTEGMSDVSSNDILPLKRELVNPLEQLKEMENTAMGEGDGEGSGSESQKSFPEVPVNSWVRLEELVDLDIENLKAEQDLFLENVDVQAQEEMDDNVREKKETASMQTQTQSGQANNAVKDGKTGDKNARKSIQKIRTEIYNHMERISSREVTNGIIGFYFS